MGAKQKISKKGSEEAKASSELKEVAVKKTGIDKWKKKKWFKIIAPKEFGEKKIGETPAEKPKTIIGRSINVSLGDLTGQRSQRHIVITFDVVDVQGDKALTRFFAHEINQSYMDRLIRRRMSKIEIVPTVTTKDNQKVKVKAVVITSKKANQKQETAIRHIVVEKIEKSAEKKDFNEFCQELVFGVIALKIFKDTKAVVPIKRTEIVKSTLV